MDNFLTQSQNGSAKIALVMQENVVANVESLTRTPQDWNRLKDFSIQVSQHGLSFCGNTFFFKVANKAVQRLTSAGIMQKMIDDRINALHKIKTRKKPKQLTVDSLRFGFEIWLGFCGLSTLVFLVEYLYVKLGRAAVAIKKFRESIKLKNRLKMIKKRRKIKRKIYKKIYNRKVLKSKIVHKNKRNKAQMPAVKRLKKISKINEKSKKAGKVLNLSYKLKKLLKI